MNRTRRSLIIAAPSFILTARTSSAQQRYPDKPIRYIVPVAAGGGADLVARTTTTAWGKVLGQSFVVDNQAGGGGVIASQTTARAAPDGYTLLQGYVATHGTNPATRSVPYDPIKDFTPIGMIGGTPNILVVDPKLPVATLAEFVEYVKKNTSASYGSAGAGSLTHLTMELLLAQRGLTMTHVPYKGIAPAFNDFLGGQTQAMFPGLTAALPYIRSNRAKPVAITGGARHPLVPNVPTLDESGLAGFDAMQWYGVVGPAKLPAEIVSVLNTSLAIVLKTPDLAEKLAGEALQPLPMSPAEFGAYIRDDIARWTKLAKERNIKLEA
ncbi:MAG TPA: tripartite tricarboxylate transporter substrate binding protein [Casimicrobiaceae bacterium]|nr:tripartite tricarboxylate transporter substrate binding protein [Casimicrobiaceae bacterium]